VGILEYTKVVLSEPITGMFPT